MRYWGGGQSVSGTGFFSLSTSVSPSLSFHLSLSLSLHWLRSIYDLGLLQDRFAGVCIPCYFYPYSLTAILFRSFSSSSIHLFLGFPTNIFPSGILLNTFFKILSFGVLCTCPKHRDIPFLISEIISGALYRLMRILNTRFSFTGRKFFFPILPSCFHWFCLAVRLWTMHYYRLLFQQ